MLQHQRFPEEAAEIFPTDISLVSILMKTLPLSRGSCCASRHNNTSNGSTEPINRSVPYQPQFCERTIGKGAAARTATIVYQQLRYWSGKGQHKFEEDGVVKVWFYKKAEELAEELQMSVPTIRRALKRLVELGLLVVRQWWKHRYFRTNFFHLPHEPETIQRDAAATAAAKNNVVRGRRAHNPKVVASTTASPPANQPSPAVAASPSTERSAAPERTNRSDQNGSHIQKRTSIEEITYLLSQPNLWRTKPENRTEQCHQCGDTGTIERTIGNMVRIHRCSCSAGNRYAHLPALIA